MKNTFSKVLVLLAIFLLAATCIVACKPESTPEPTPEPLDPVIYSLELVADKTQAVSGEKVTLSATLKSADKEEELKGLVYTIVEGADYATIEGNVLTIGNDVKDGSVIKVKTTKDGINSNVVAITVIPSTHVDSIHITTNSESQSVMKGSTVALVATVSPAGIAQSFVEWEIVEGADIATISGTSLSISANAATGSVIKVRAFFGDVVSNEITLTVASTQEEINAGRYFIDIVNDNVVVDKNGTYSIPLAINVYDYNMKPVNNVDVDFVVSEGENLLGITPNGYWCELEAKGHGTAKVTVSVSGTTESKTVDVRVIVPPEALTLPEVFAERPMAYKFSMRDALPFTPGVVGSEYACKDFVYSFVHESGKTGDEVAVYNYEKNEIEFRMTGKVVVTAQSDSGSRVESRVSYTFDINNGYNVYNFAELKHLVQVNSAYNGQEINVVVLENPSVEGGYEYGYDLVPPVAFLPESEQTAHAILRGVYVDNVRNAITGETVGTYLVNARVQAVNKSLWLNGNDHCINASQIRQFTSAEYEAYKEAVGETVNVPNVSSILSAEAWAEGGAGSNASVDNQTYSVKLYDIEVMGNTSVGDDLAAMGYTNGICGGVTRVGISVGSREYDAHYYLDADDLTVSQCGIGINLCGIVGNGTISDIYAYNIYQTGLMMKGSVVTIENPKFGMCGATAVEMAPEEHREAGLNDDQIQNVTFVGNIDFADNLNNMNTQYFQHYAINVGGQSATIPQIVNMNMAMYSEEVVGHLMNDKGEFIFVSLIFNDFAYIMDYAGGNADSLFINRSSVYYAEYQAGGIINIGDIDGVDTTHQFIKIPVMVTIPGLGTVNAGTAIFYNHNYVPAN